MKPSRIQQKGSVTRVWYDDCKNGDEYNFCLSSDEHYDSPFCERGKLASQLREAKDIGAGIFRFGDWFDAMQGNFDPRKSFDGLRPEYRCENYYDSVVDDSINYLSEYASNHLLIGKGNHETAVLTKINTCLVSRLAGGLNKQPGANVMAGYIGGWIVLKFSGTGGGRQSFRIRYHHGTGGNAPVTKGILDANRQAVWLGNVDLVANGHNHKDYITSQPRVVLNRRDEVEQSTMWFVRTGGYKDEFDEGDGYGNRGNFGPTSNGCVWMNLKYIKTNRDGLKIRCRLTTGYD